MPETDLAAPAPAAEAPAAAAPAAPESATPSAAPATPAAPEAAPSFEFLAGEGLPISEAGKAALLAHYEKLSGYEGEQAKASAQRSVAAALEHTAELTKFASEHGLSPEQAKGLFARDHARYTQQQDALIKAWEGAAAQAEAASRADPVIGGANYDKTTEAMKVMVAKFGAHKTHGLSWDRFTELGLDRDPAVRHFLNNLYQGQREPTQVTLGQPAKVKSDPLKTIYDKSYDQMVARK